MIISGIFIVNSGSSHVNYFIYGSLIQVETEEQKKFDEFFALNYYVQGSYDQSKDFEILNKEIQVREKSGKANRLFYFALPPSVYEVLSVIVIHIDLNLDRSIYINELRNERTTVFISVSTSEGGILK